ncbi:KH domain-containing, RNA-binding, signal transduction-associated protein 2 [Aphelenchoides besseyi]|nr:KH domain-containing, RNA-binding, signal transduction-associated protein 2 [Aphelenchoides besseyi]
MRRNDPPTASWTNSYKQVGGREYYDHEPSTYREHREYATYGQEFDAVDERAVGSGFDRFNGNQPVYPTVEERQPTGSRKRPFNDTSSAFYPPKVPRSHDSRPGSFGAHSQQYAGDGSSILKEESKKCISEMNQELANNVVGRILGVGGSTLRKMCQTYKCHISISGAGSRKNPRDEQELLRSGDHRYSHLACPLHAEISTTGPPHLAYSRLGQILTLLHRIITSDETFEHDGMLFELTQRRHTREQNDEGYGDYQDEEPHDFSMRRGHSRGTHRGGSYRRQTDSHEEDRPFGDPSGNTYQQIENETDTGEFRRSPNGDSPGRGGSVRRSRGGMVPRGRGGFVPRGRGNGRGRSD